jgi:hypothetical protein
MVQNILVTCMPDTRPPTHGRDEKQRSRCYCGQLQGNASGRRLCLVRVRLHGDREPHFSVQWGAVKDQVHVSKMQEHQVLQSADVFNTRPVSQNRAGKGHGVPTPRHKALQASLMDGTTRIYANRHARPVMTTTRARTRPHPRSRRMVSPAFTLPQ